MNKYILGNFVKEWLETRSLDHPLLSSSSSLYEKIRKDVFDSGIKLNLKIPPSILFLSLIQGQQCPIATPLLEQVTPLEIKNWQDFENFKGDLTHIRSVP